ncbi:MAG: SDR family oxidoreductase [Mariprofundus sp.]|nr:SDR family oxidoreductase [Mariprofundus sp.]
MSEKLKCLLILGCGYVGEKLAAACLADGMRVIATTRDLLRAEVLAKQGIEAIVVRSPLELSDELLAAVDGVVDSIPLSRDQTGIHATQLLWLPQLTERLLHLRWAGYLSSTAVYGDAGGAWVDESSICRPSSERGGERLKAEKTWLESGLAAEIFRLAGIYGVERNILGRLKSDAYKAVQWNPPHYASRIHVDDIVAALMAAMQKPRAGRIVNLADDLPLPHAEYVCEVAAMIGAPMPQMLTESEGEAVLSPSMLAFFRDNKRVSNRLLHQELLPSLQYPSFRTAMGELDAN